MSTTLFMRRSPVSAGGPGVISYTSRTAWSTSFLCAAAPFAERKVTSEVSSEVSTNSTPLARRMSSLESSSSASAFCAPRSQSASSSHASNARRFTMPSAAKHTVRMLASCTGESFPSVGAYRSTPRAQNPAPLVATAGGTFFAHSPSVGLRPRRPATVTAPWLRTSERSTALRSARTILASAFITRNVSSIASSSAEDTKSVLFNTSVSAKAICRLASLVSRS
mmetsp:Transcript_9720/g.40800  ORF Transcript_9720/g.40800 Transcript_9720/m.40800 type:complete len:224 (+) Transcript_9720:132-803(+)